MLLHICNPGTEGQDDCSHDGRRRRSTENAVNNILHWIVAENMLHEDAVKDIKNSEVAKDLLLEGIAEDALHERFCGGYIAQRL